MKRVVILGAFTALLALTGCNEKNHHGDRHLGLPNHLSPCILTRSQNTQGYGSTSFGISQGVVMVLKVVATGCCNGV